MLLGIPHNASDSVVTHVAFCPACQQRLQILHTGTIFTETDSEPNWDLLLKQLKLAARWSTMKRKISSVFNNPLALFPDLDTAPVRLAKLTPSSITMTIFEINLTMEPTLSSTGLTITPFQQNSESDTFMIEISGFLPELHGAEIQLGFARKQSYLAACNYRINTLDWDLLKIEKQLQRAYTRSSSPSKRLSKLIDNSVWITGTLRAQTDSNNDVRLILTPSDSASLFFRNDVWAMLLVGKPNI